MGLGVLLVALTIATFNLALQLQRQQYPVVSDDH